jgi:hypothetical protein
MMPTGTRQPAQPSFEVSWQELRGFGRIEHLAVRLRRQAELIYS